MLAAELDRASLRPPLVAGAELENALGTGEASGLQSAELTLTLASMLERGGKLDARRTLAQSRIDALAVERETRRLDLLAEVARRYLAVVAASHQRQIAELDIAQRKRTVAGRTPSPAGRRIARIGGADRAGRSGPCRTGSRARRPATARGASTPGGVVGRARSGLRRRVERSAAPAAVADFSALSELLERTPELAQFADERRIREARLQLARIRGQRRPRLAGRRASVAGDATTSRWWPAVSMPLGADRRAQPEIRAAEAELASLEIEREAKGLSLYSTLAEAHGRYRTAQVEVTRLRDDILPKLAKAEAAAERAYRAGAISYLEWAQLQSERTAARKQQLDAALDAQRALIEIQRLTGEAFVAAPTHAANKEPPREDLSFSGSLLAVLVAPAGAQVTRPGTATTSMARRRVAKGEHGGRLLEQDSYAVELASPRTARRRSSRRGCTRTQARDRQRSAAHASGNVERPRTQAQADGSLMATASSASHIPSMSRLANIDGKPCAGRTELRGPHVIAAKVAQSRHPRRAAGRRDRRRARSAGPADAGRRPHRQGDGAFPRTDPQRCAPTSATQCAPASRWPASRAT